MSEEILGIYLSDKITKSNEYRWKILVFFNNGIIQEVACPSVNYNKKNSD